MTELQVKAKKGSLKKFLATFLAVCLCMTTVHMNGTFVQAQESRNNDVSASVAVKDGKGTIELKLGENVTADVAEHVVVSPSDASLKVEIPAASAEYVRVVNNSTVIGAVKATGEEGVKVIAKVGDGAKQKAEITVKIGEEKPTPTTATIEFADGVTPGVALKVGDSADFGEKVKVTPKGTKVSWKSSSKEVTVAENGLVTAVSPTDAAVDVTAKVGDGDKQSVVFKVTVVKDGLKPSSDPSIKVIDEKPITLKVDATASVAEKVEVSGDNATVAWTLGEGADEFVAIDANGVVTAKKATKGVKVIGTVGDGSKENQKAEITVIVEEDKGNSKPVDTVAIDPKTAEIEVGKSTTLTVTINPSDADDQKVSWEYDKTVLKLTENGKTATVEGLKAADKTVVTAKVADKTATATIKVKAKAVNPPAANPTITGISLNKATADVNKNKTVTLVATVKGTGNFNKAVTWESSNKKVATVDGNGKVKGVAKGTATIKATTADKKFSAECKVTVKVPATKVTVSSNKKVYLVVKKSITIGAAVEPADTTDSVKWSTKNKKIATVSKGKITGKKVGKTTITAKAGSKSAKVEVNVVKKATNATKITLNKKTLKINTGASAALQAKLTPAKATTEVKWSVDKAGKKVVNIKNGIVTGKKAGVATITAKAGKKTAKCVVTVTKAGVKTKLKKANGTVKVKKTLKITLKGDSKDTIASCTTSNKKIATVKVDKKKKSATITGKKKGTATITVVTKKGAVLTFKATVKK